MNIYITLLKEFKMFKIDKTIPFPKNAKGAYRSGPNGGRPAIYPWREMAPGDSVFFPMTTAARMSGTLGGWKKKNPGQRFTTRKEGDGLRVWRVE